MIHARVDSSALMLSRMVGRATLTIVVSSSDMNKPTSSTARDAQARRFEMPTGAVHTGPAGVLGLAESVMSPSPWHSTTLPRQIPGYAMFRPRLTPVQTLPRLACEWAMSPAPTRLQGASHER